MKYGNYNIKGFLLSLIFLFLLISCAAEFKFKSDELSDFLNELDEKYDYITESKAFKRLDQIVIKIYFENGDHDTFDVSIYDDLKLFFWNVDNQNLIISDFDEDLLEGSNYPSIRVYFIDSAGEISHYIVAPTEHIDYGNPNVITNRYAEWDPPIYKK